MSVKMIINMLMLLLMSVLALASCFGAGQNRRGKNPHKTWSPPDRSFTVELPVRLEEIQGEYDELSHDSYKSIKLFGSSKADVSNGVFEVLILEVSHQRELSVKDKLKGLEFLIGGDNQKPTKVRHLRINGLPAKEVVFLGKDRCSKGLMIDAGDRIYILGLVVNLCEDLDSMVAQRFFGTFNLLRRGTTL
jgi:hypothetical protein